MGTNYYFNEDVCPHCNRPANVVHIGKSSMGWKFSFRGYFGLSCPFGRESDIRSFADWKEIFQNLDGRITNEYGEEISVEDFCKMVESKQTERWGIATCLIDALAGDSESQKMFGPWYHERLLEEYHIDDEGYEFNFQEFC